MLYVAAEQRGGPAEHALWQRYQQHLLRCVSRIGAGVPKLTAQQSAATGPDSLNTLHSFILQNHTHALPAVGGCKLPPPMRSLLLNPASQLLDT